MKYVKPWFEEEVEIDATTPMPMAIIAVVIIGVEVVGSC